MMRSQHPPHTTILSLVQLCNLMMAKQAETCRSLTSNKTSCVLTYFTFISLSLLHTQRGCLNCRLFIYIHIYIYTHTHIYMYMCCAFVVLGNKLYKMQGTYTKIPGVVLKYWYGVNNRYKAESLERCRMTLDNRDSSPQEKQTNDACNSHRSQIIYTF